jgi:hypothetical protein
MLAFKEFANFINLNIANLATTYARLLAERNEHYATIPADSRVTSARRLLKAVVAAYESQTSTPLIHLFDRHNNKDSGRWLQEIIPSQPLLEVQCLGQTLMPVVTNR